MTNRTATTLQLVSNTPGKLALTLQELSNDLEQKLSLDEDATARVALVAQELLESLAPYSVSPSASIDVELQDRDGQSYVRIRTRNSSTPEGIESLCEALDAVKDAPNALALYDEVLTSNLGRNDAGRLAFARIRAEAEMELSYSVERSEVTVVAEALVKSA